MLSRVAFNAVCSTHSQCTRSLRFREKVKGNSGVEEGLKADKRSNEIRYQCGKKKFPETIAKANKNRGRY